MAALYMSTTKITHLIAISMFLAILYFTLLSITYAEEQDELRCEKVKYYRLDECRMHCARVFAKDFTYFLRVTGGDFECCCKRKWSFPPPQSPPGPSSDVEIIAATDDGIHA
ncbi:hypothetical protein EJB05_55898 [Eragrostis curvula]|uniref:Uncharacterized protein n=1 Tax=Eragrostis curvula TaxID=38414 RepID=A0A5J9SIK4_9POAL|nr:hypothetical protein EJB05_55897 [Eragrostis curvula]TVT98777.1 hypothetical protein EJB05_55898 [Eragrostis curvula]